MNIAFFGNTKMLDIAENTVTINKVQSLCNTTIFGVALSLKSDFPEHPNISTYETTLH